MGLDRDKIKKQAGQLLDRIKDLQDSAKTVQAIAGTDAELTKKFNALIENKKAVEDEVRKLAELFEVTGVGEASATFGEFLSQVGNAVVTAQEDLDQHNRARLADAMAGRTAPPLGVFQIPKLKGDIRFAFSETTDRKLGLIFYSRKDQSETRNEQSLSFEILSVPPSPELLQAVRELRPEIRLVLSRAEREAVFSALENVDRLLGAENKPITSPANLLDTHRNALLGRTDPPDPTEQDAVIMLPANQAKDGSDGRYVILYAAKPKTEDYYVGVWLFDVTSLSLHVLWRYDLKGAQTEDVALFKNWVREVAEKQKVILGLLRGSNA